jgi:hypothetical protein
LRCRSCTQTGSSIKVRRLRVVSEDEKRQISTTLGKRGKNLVGRLENPVKLPNSSALTEGSEVVRAYIPETAWPHRGTRRNRSKFGNSCRNSPGS